MNKTPAPTPFSPERAGKVKAHAAAVTNDAGDNGRITLRRESMGTAQGEGAVTLSPTNIIAELNRAKCEFQLRGICNAMGLPIDTESDAGSYADALAHSVNIKVFDFNHVSDLPQEGKQNNNIGD